MSHSNYLSALFLLALLPLSYDLQALPSDKDQPIHIASDRAQRNTLSGETTYSGDVEMNQGTLSIRADHITIRSDKNNKASEIVAKGSPAHYQQIPETSKPLVIAKGDTIVYSIAKGQLVLTDNASLQQDDGTLITGSRIFYDTKASVVTANGGGNDNNSGRIHMVIPPKAKSP